MTSSNSGGAVARPHFFGHGRLAYVQIPAVYVQVSAAQAAGSTIVKPPYPEGDIWVATAGDPAGNEIGIWQRDPR